MEPTDHQCLWRDEALALRKLVADQAEKLDAVLGQLQVLERRVLGPKSEKMPPPADELRRAESKEDAEARRLAGLERRRQRAALKQKLRQQIVIHRVADDEKQCPKCGETVDALLGEGKRTTVYEYVPGYFVRQEHVLEKLACRCGQYIATAEPPPRALDKSQYGAGFIAHLCVMKCADSIPLHRLAKQYQRLGIPMARSTLTDLFHRAGEKLEPLWKRLLAIIAASEIVQADETSMKMQRPNKRGFVWTFLADDLIAYRFADNRSGDTPLEVLGGTSGTLVIDGYTGYNRVPTSTGATALDVSLTSGAKSSTRCRRHPRRRAVDWSSSSMFIASSTKPRHARSSARLSIWKCEGRAHARR